MKKGLFLGVFFVCASLAVSAQGFYFDIGLGLGKAWTEINGYDFVKELEAASGGKLNEIAVDFGLKAGYGPFGNIPLYAVGEVGGIGHRVYDSYNYIQFTSCIIGPGVLFYPIPLVQLGFSIGYSFVDNITDIPGTVMYDSKGGFAWNVSAAVDLGGSNHACLLGVKYFAATNTLETSNGKEKASMISFFAKYAFRKRAPSLIN